MSYTVYCIEKNLLCKMLDTDYFFDCLKSRMANIPQNPARSGLICPVKKPMEKVRAKPAMRNQSSGLR